MAPAADVKQCMRQPLGLITAISMLVGFHLLTMAFDFSLIGMLVPGVEPLAQEQAALAVYSYHRHVQVRMFPSNMLVVATALAAIGFELAQLVRVRSLLHTAAASLLNWVCLICMLVATVLCLMTLNITNTIAVFNSAGEAEAVISEYGLQLVSYDACFLAVLLLWLGAAVLRIKLVESRQALTAIIVASLGMFAGALLCMSLFEWGTTFPITIPGYDMFMQEVDLGNQGVGSLPFTFEFYLHLLKNMPGYSHAAVALPLIIGCVLCIVRIVVSKARPEMVLILDYFTFILFFALGVCVIIISFPLAKAVAFPVSGITPQLQVYAVSGAFVVNSTCLAMALATVSVQVLRANNLTTEEDEKKKNE